MTARIVRGSVGGGMPGVFPDYRYVAALPAEPITQQNAWADGRIFWDREFPRSIKIGRIATQMIELVDFEARIEETPGALRRTIEVWLVPTYWTPAMARKRLSSFSTDALLPEEEAIAAAIHQTFRTNQWETKP